MTLLVSSLTAPAFAAPEIKERIIDRVRVRLDVSPSEDCPGSFAERVHLVARQSRDAETGDVVRRHIQVDSECIDIEGTEAVVRGAMLWDAARLRRFTVDPETGAISLRFIEHPGINTDTNRPSPVWWLIITPQREVEADDDVRLNRCDGVTVRDNARTHVATVSGELFGPIDFNHQVDRARIEHWTQTAVCLS